MRAAPGLRDIEPVGPVFLQLLRRRAFGTALSDALMQVAEQEAFDAGAGSDAEDAADGLSDEDEVPPELMRLDLSEWKTHDHYAIIGLKKLRCWATEAQLRNAYRRRVLRY